MKALPAVALLLFAKLAMSVTIDVLDYQTLSTLQTYLSSNIDDVYATIYENYDEPDGVYYVSSEIDINNRTMDTEISGFTSSVVVAPRIRAI